MQRILGYMRKAIQEFDLIQNGDRIAVGVSGGKDSVALLVGLARLRRFIGIDYEVVGLTLDPQFGRVPGDYSAIEALCKELEIPYVVKQTQIGEIVFDARQESNPCSLCARMRRGALHDTAKELGCKNTHFANPHGLNNENHKTTPYDMALILRAAVANDTFRKIDTTTSYQFPAIKNAAARTITMGHKMMYKTDSRYYEGIIGGKTGYTSKAGNTLVTAVERDGVRLIAVVMKAKGTHYTDTRAMLDYGFALHDAGKI